MATQPKLSPLQAWVNDTKPMLGQAKSKEPPPLPTTPPPKIPLEIAMKLGAESKNMMAKAQKAGEWAVGVIADEFARLRREVNAEAQKRNKDDLPKLVPIFMADFEKFKQRLDRWLDSGQAEQDAKESQQLKRAWARKVAEPLSQLPDSLPAIKADCLAENKKFEAALSAGKLDEAQQIFDNVAGVILPRALSEFKLQKDKDAYLAQMMKQASAEFNPGNKFDPKKMEQWNEIVADLTDHTGSGLSQAEVLAIRVYTASNYKYINPAVANQKDRPKDRPKDWMDAQQKPDPAKAEEILKDQAKKMGDPDPTKAEIAAKKKELEKKLKEYEEGGKQTLYEEGALHAGMMIEAFKKLPKKQGKLYRGARMNQAMFDREYSEGKIITYEAFVSNATQERVARGFADGSDGANPDQTISVFAEAEMLDARDIMAISLVKGETEWLVPPGTQLRVEKIEDDTVKNDGALSKAPKATAWKKVFLKQVLEGS